MRKPEQAVQPEPLTVGSALLQAHSQGLGRLDAQRLLLHALGRPATERAWLLTHDHQALPSPAQASFTALCSRHADGEPMAYLVGEQAFFSLTLSVDARVLIPRPDTETLVNWALATLAEHGAPAGARVLDLGTGSGAIALALKHALPALALSAIDASPDAVTVAQANAHRLGLNVAIHLSQWFDAVQGTFELIVSNPPYIRDADPHLAALAHEPLQALTAGRDGLDDLRRIIEGAPAHLVPGGCLLLEHGYDQAEAVRALLRVRGFESISSVTDLAGIERCSGGRWTGGLSKPQSP